MSDEVRTPPPASAFTPPAPRVETSPRWVRTTLGGTTVADSRDPVLHVAFGPPLVQGSREPLLPGYFFPAADVRTDLLTPSGEDDVRRWWDLTVEDRTVPRAAWTYRDARAVSMDLTGHVTFRWEAMDAWYEESEQVYVHARDPRKRVDVRASARHVEVSLNGEVLADSDKPRLLFETDLPTRYYLPREHVRLDRLIASETVTGCPYKGTAEYWSVRDGGPGGTDIAWTYPQPVEDCPWIRDLVCFFNEKVDIIVDGQLVPRPHTPWS